MEERNSMTRSVTSPNGKGKPTMRRGRLWAAVIGLSLLLSPVIPASVVHAGDDLTTMIEHAKTAADHEAIATEYEKKAADAKKEADLHRKMEKSYTVGGAAGGKGTATALPQHCAALAKHYDELAQEYTTLAKAHRDMAKAAK
jgi:hypothetical protein